MARTKEFDEQQVLLAAMHVFWELGYDGASLPDLLAATGLSRSSLYEFFGDKRALFLRTLHLYTDQARGRREKAFNDPRGLVAGLTDFFEARIDSSRKGNQPAGCFFTSVSASLKNADDELRAFVKQLSDAYESKIFEGFERALANGEISARLSAREWTANFLCFSWGLNVALRMGTDQQTLTDMVHSFIRLLEK